MNDENILINHILLNTSCVYVKFGDGEYYAAINRPGGNCDGTKYTMKLGNSIINSFKYLISIPNVYIGKRQEEPVIQYFEMIAEGSPINWVDYHVFMFRDISTFLKEKFILYKTISLASQQKIYICNDKLVEKSKKIFKIDNHIIIHPVNWFELDFSIVFNSVCRAVKDPNNLLILISAGMGGKFLIKCLHKAYPNAILFDIGSAFDQLCGSVQTRSYHVLSELECNKIEESILV